MRKFGLIGLGAAMMLSAMGCTTNGGNSGASSTSASGSSRIAPPGGWVWHPGDPTPARSSDILGYWAMPIMQTAPEKPGDPPRLVDIRGWIIFLDDGTYQSSTTLDGRTTEESGKWRMRQQFFNYVYLRPNGRDHEGQFSLHITPESEELIYFSLEEPPYAPINLTYNRCMVPGRTVRTTMMPKEIRKSPW